MITLEPIDLTLYVLILICGCLLSYSQGRLDEIRAHHRRWMHRSGYRQMRFPADTRPRPRRIITRAPARRSPWHKARLERLFSLLRFRP